MEARQEASFERLRRSLVKARYPAEVDVGRLLAGHTGELVTIVHYMLTLFSRRVAVQVAEAGCILHSKDQLRFVHAFFKAMRSVFGVQPPMTESQFTAPGFAERKLDFVARVADLVLERDRELARAEQRVRAARMLRIGTGVAEKPTAVHLARVAATSAGPEPEVRREARREMAGRTTQRAAPAVFDDVDDEDEGPSGPMPRVACPPRPSTEFSPLPLAPSRPPCAWPRARQARAEDVHEVVDERDEEAARRDGADYDYAESVEEDDDEGDLRAGHERENEDGAEEGQEEGDEEEKDDGARVQFPTTRSPGRGGGRGREEAPRDPLLRSDEQSVATVRGLLERVLTRLDDLESRFGRSVSGLTARLVLVEGQSKMLRQQLEARSAAPAAPTHMPESSFPRPVSTVGGPTGAEAASAPVSHAFETGHESLASFIEGARLRDERAREFLRRINAEQDS